jgi:hypothetical protein
MQSALDGASLPMPSVSPRAYNHRNDLKKQLYLTQREIMNSAMRPSSPGRTAKPVSPRLAPVGSPGPVTPLELEQGDGYLVAGARYAASSLGSPADMVESMIEQEAQRSQTRPQHHN